jgi:hypothetical protein
MHAGITLQLKPMTALKPRIVLDAAADVARRIGCHVEIEVNERTVRISPTAAKGAVFDDWSAKAEADAAALNGAAARA